MKKLGETIYNLRKGKGLSQEKLAEQLNVMRQTVSRWETDSVLPTKENLDNLCVIFNVKLSYFLDDEIAVEHTNEELTIKEQASASNDIKTEKSEQFKILKILSVVVGMTLLGFMVVALGIAAYVSIAPSIGGVWGDASNNVNYEGVFFIVFGTVGAAVFITLTILIIMRTVKKRQKSRMQPTATENATRF